MHSPRPFALTVTPNTVIVKNTGHDFCGRSSGQGGFALWTHLLNTTTRNSRFVPKDCHRAPQDSVTLGAGVQWLQAFKFAAAQNITLVGGAPQVGAAGGWILVRGTAATMKTSNCH